MVYTVKYLLSAWFRAYTYSSLISALTAELWHSASKAITILGVMWPSDSLLCLVMVCAGVWQHKQLYCQRGSAIVSVTLALLAGSSNSATQGLNDYKFTSFKMPLCLGNAPSLPRSSRGQPQGDATALDREKHPGCFHRGYKIIQKVSWEVRGNIDVPLDT